MTSYRRIQAAVLVLIVALALGSKAEAQRFRGGGFSGRAGFRAPSVAYGRNSRPLPGYAPGGFRTGYAYAPYQRYGYGFNRLDRSFRYRSAYGYPYGYGYPFAYGSGYGYPYYGDGDYGSDFLPESSYADGWQGTEPMAGTPAVVDGLQWPLGLRILPGADALRERIDGLYAVAAGQPLTRELNPALPAEMKRAVRELQRLVARDKQEKLTLSSAMYEQAEGFLRELARTAGRLAALESAPASNAPAGPTVIPARK